MLIWKVFKYVADVFRWLHMEKVILDDKTCDLLLFYIR